MLGLRSDGLLGRGNGRTISNPANIIRFAILARTRAPFRFRRDIVHKIATFSLARRFLAEIDREIFVFSFRALRVYTYLKTYTYDTRHARRFQFCFCKRILYACDRRKCSDGNTDGKSNDEYTPPTVSLRFGRYGRLTVFGTTTRYRIKRRRIP